MIEREYSLEHLKAVSKKLLGNLRKILEEASPYKGLRMELEKEFFDPVH